MLSRLFNNYHNCIMKNVGQRFDVPIGSTGVAVLAPSAAGLLWDASGCRNERHTFSAEKGEGCVHLRLTPSARILLMGMLPRAISFPSSLW